jgi:hypothetical protein
MARTSRHVSALPNDGLRRSRASANARLNVTLHFQDAVNDGRAQWRISAEGQTELHLLDGGILLLTDLGVTRLV